MEQRPLLGYDVLIPCETIRLFGSYATNPGFADEETAVWSTIQPEGC